VSGTPTLPAGDRYVLVSADCHAGGSMEQYREYLAPEYHDEFDAWRGAYKNRSATCSVTGARAIGTTS
jgi:hypothetical protein